MTTRAFHLFCLCALVWSSQLFAQTEVQALALFKDRAMLSVNGKKAKIIRVGQVYQNVKLLSANTQQAEVELNGKREILGLNSAVILSNSLGSKPANRDAVRLWADHAGFFKGQGTIDGQGLEFLVDTGANLVVLSSKDADKIGLKYKHGSRTYATTASGTTPMYGIMINSLNFSGIELDRIQAGVIQGSFPTVPLLGMSFLKRVDMERSGNQMELKKRF